MASRPAELLKLKTTPLYSIHCDFDGRIVPFAGYAMPLQYAAGIIAEHNHTRTNASLFDISHMTQIRLHGAKAAAELERLVPGDITGLSLGQIRYTMLTSKSGGIIDDIMVTRERDALLIIVNASRFDIDLHHLKQHLGERVEIEVLANRALIALQGPAAAAVLGDLAIEITYIKFINYILDLVNIMKI